MSLEKYLSSNNIVAISNIDTRALTRHLRINGALKGCIKAANNINSDQAIEKAKEFYLQIFLIQMLEKIDLLLL